MVQKFIHEKYGAIDVEIINGELFIDSEQLNIKNCSGKLTVEDIGNLNIKDNKYKNYLIHILDVCSIHGVKSIE